MIRVHRCLIALTLSLPLIGLVPSPESGLAQSSDPGEPGTLQVDTREYNFGDEALTPTDFPGAVELRASVHHPKDLSGGPFPLVILLHGRHATCFPITPETQLAWPCPSGTQPIPSFEGYAYIAEILASHGYIVVSISANGVNSKDEPTVPDNGALARAELIQRHLEIWKDLNVGSGVVDPFGVAPFGELFVGKVDLGRVGTMGHSRGGEGAVRHFVLNLEEGAPFGVRAVFALAPTNSNRLIINNVPLAVLLPYCDGDVFTLEGVHYYDDARYSISGDPAAKHTILVMGANHNFYNIVWTPGLFAAGAADDWLGLSEDAQRDPHCGPSISGNGRLSDSEQRGTGVAYASAFFRVYVGGETQFLPILAGDPSPPSAKTSEVHVSYHAPNDPTLRRDLNRLTDTANLASNTLGGATSQAGLNPYEFCGVSAACLPDNMWQIGREPHFPGLGQLSAGWTETSAVFRNEIPSGSRDLRAFQWLQFRVSVDFADPKNSVGSSQDFSIVLIDGSGGTALTRASQWTRSLYYPPGDPDLITPVPKAVLNMVRIPLPALTGIDLGDIRAVEFRFDRNAAGALLITELALAGTRAVLPPTPAPSFPRLPICGDQDGSETPFVLRCPDLVWAGDVQLYQVPGTGPVELRFDFVFREAAFNNELAFFLVDDALGRIDGIAPGEPGYLATAFARAQVIFPSGSNAFAPDVSMQLEGAKLIVFFIVQDNRLSTLLANNPNNELNKRPLAFFSLNALNPDGIDHFVGYDNPALDITHFGFEDLTGGGDRNFDDIVYNVAPRLQPLTARIHLSPLSAEKAVGETHALTSEVRGKDGNPVPGELVVFEVQGANPTTGSASTNASGVATFSYVGADEGDDTVVARTSEAISNTAIVVWRSRCPIRVFFGGGSTATADDAPAHEALFLIHKLQQAVDVVRLLERVQDEVLATTPQGQAYIQLFSLQAGEITDLMLADASLRDQGVATVEAFVSALQSLVDGRGNEAVVTSDQVGAVQSFLQRLLAVGRPALTQAIESELARRPLEPIVGMTMDEAWGYLNNLPPAADAGGPYTGNAGEPISFNGSGSFDPDGEIVLYEWDFESDGVFDMSSEEPAATHTYPGEFSGTATLRVTDNDGNTGTDTALVEVQAPANQPPTANAGPDQTVECSSSAGAVVSLDGSGSSDPDGDPLTFSWSASGITFDDPTSATPTATFPLGTTRASLVVNDGRVDSDPDIVDITVQDTTAPTISAQWVPLKVEEEEGAFRLEFSASDVCDLTPEVMGVVETPPLDGLKVKLKTKSAVEILFDLDEGVVKIQGPAPRALLAQLRQFGGLLVESGQRVEIKLKDGDEDELEFKFDKDGKLKVEAPSVVLAVTSEDASGNASTSRASPQFAPGEDDDDDGDGEDKDDDESSGTPRRD